MKVRFRRPTYSDIYKLHREKINKLNENPTDGYNFTCRFTRGYLRQNKEKGIGKGFTPYSYLNYFYSTGSKREQEKIVQDIEDNPSCAFRFLSVNGAIAYYPMSLFDKEKCNEWKTIIAISRLDPKISMRELMKKIN